MPLCICIIYNHIKTNVKKQCIMNEEELFLESLDFIKMNLDVTFDEVPEHLTDFWRLDNFTDLYREDLASTKQWSVFMYALLAYKKEKNIMEFKLRVNEFVDLFITWQTILAIAEVSLKTDINVKPVKLFDFDNLNDDIIIL